jgi:urea transport system permease protein
MTGGARPSPTTGGMIFTLLAHDLGSRIFLAATLALAVLVPALNLAVPESSAFHVPSFAVSLFGKYLCFALLALSVDLIWGFCGILSLGHGAFFALGGYAMGMHIMREIGPRGVYGDPVLPDFMVFLNWQELPWFWHGFDMFWFAVAMVMVVPGLLGFLFGWLAFRSRVSGVYFSIISQALTYALMLAFFRNDMGFGGNNGLTDFKDILGFDLRADTTRGVLFTSSALALIGGFAVCRIIVASKIGRVLIAIRDAEARARFVGYRTDTYKVFVFTVSAVLAGIAGALYVPQVGIINPSEFSPLKSIEIVVWVALGGRGSLYGAVLGAVSVNALKSYFTALAPEVWLFLLGGLFVVITLFLPKGLVGSGRGLAALARLLPIPAARLSARRASGTDAPGTETPS